MSHADKAVEYYCHNFNCSQGIFTTYAVENGLDEKLALKLGTCFGGGSRKGEMCGAVAGALMVIGLLYGHSDGNDLDSKAKAYALSEEYMNRFIKENTAVFIFSFARTAAKNTAVPASFFFTFKNFLSFRTR